LYCQGYGLGRRKKLYVKCRCWIFVEEFVPIPIIESTQNGDAPKRRKLLFDDNVLLTSKPRNESAAEEFGPCLGAVGIELANQNRKISANQIRLLSPQILIF
jgi:hypothetical protein